MEDAEEYSEQNSDTIDPKTTVMDLIQQKIQSASLPDESRLICENMAHAYNVEFADPLHPRASSTYISKTARMVLTHLLLLHTRRWCKR